MTKESVATDTDNAREIVVDLGYIYPESQSSTDDLYRELQRRDQKIGEALQQKGSNDTITVAELAVQIGRSEHVTRNLLDRDEIPGAYRKTPGVKNSPWIIWADAPAAFLAKHTGANS